MTSRMYELAAIIRQALVDKAEGEQEALALEITYALEDTMPPEFQSMRFYNALRCKGCKLAHHLHDLRIYP